MPRLPYPALAFDNLSQAIDIFWSGKIAEELPLFADLAWNLQGAIQALALGDPDHLPAAASVEDADAQADLEERLDQFASILNRVLIHFSETPVGSTAAAETGVVDPATILAIVNVVLQLIDAWRKRRQKPSPAPTPVA